jgi:hypothetical protein
LLTVRIVKHTNPDCFALEALPLRGRLVYCIVGAWILISLDCGWWPFEGADVVTRVLGTIVLGGGAAVYAFGRFGTIIDREAGTLCNWYECLGLGIRWTFPMKPTAVRIECRLGGHREVSDLQYTRHLFLLNRIGPPLRIGRVKGVGEARELAARLGELLGVPIEEGGCKPSDQVCFPPPWANLGDGFFRGASVFVCTPGRAHDGCQGL